VNIFFTLLAYSDAPALDSWGRKNSSFRFSGFITYLYNSAIVNQLQSSIGFSFHFTKYWKYVCPWVFLNILWSKIASTYFMGAFGACSSQSTVWIFAVVISFYNLVSASLNGYKSTTLKMGDILIPSGNSISYALAENFLLILQGPIFFSLSLL